MNSNNLPTGSTFSNSSYYSSASGSVSIKYDNFNDSSNSILTAEGNLYSASNTIYSAFVSLEPEILARAGISSASDFIGQIQNCIDTAKQISSKLKSVLIKAQTMNQQMLSSVPDPFHAVDTIFISKPNKYKNEIPAYMNYMNTADDQDQNMATPAGAMSLFAILEGGTEFLENQLDATVTGAATFQDTESIVLSDAEQDKLEQLRAEELEYVKPFVAEDHTKALADAFYNTEYGKYIESHSSISRDSFTYSVFKTIGYNLPGIAFSMLPGGVASTVVPVLYGVSSMGDSYATSFQNNLDDETAQKLAVKNGLLTAGLFRAYGLVGSSEAATLEKMIINGDIGAATPILNASLTYLLNPNDGTENTWDARFAAAGGESAVVGGFLAGFGGTGMGERIQTTPKNTEVKVEPAETDLFNISQMAEQIRPANSLETEVTEEVNSTISSSFKEILDNIDIATTVEVEDDILNSILTEFVKTPTKETAKSEANNVVDTVESESYENG